MAAGLPGAMIPARPYELASDTVRLGIFKAPTADDGYRIAREMQIDYLFTGRPERHFYRPAVMAMEAAPNLFERVFRNDAITIFKVRK